MKRWIHAKSNIEASVGTSPKTKWFFIEYPDRTPLVNKDTGNAYMFDTEEEAQQALDNNYLIKEWYPNARIEHKTIYSVYHD